MTMGYKQILRMMVLLLLLGVQACAADGSSGCFKLRCTADELNDETQKKSCLNGQQMKKYELPIGVPGEGTEVGVVSYLTAVIRDKAMKSSEKIYKKVIGDQGFKNLVKAAMALFVIIYAITIALGMANPSPAELTVRAAKMAAIFFFLTSWGNFDKQVVQFFESFVDGLTNVMTSAITGSSDVTGRDVMSFIDNKVLGYLFSVKFAVTLGAVATASSSGAGLVIAPMLFGVMLSYLWSLVIGIQIYLLSSIARALLYAIAPVFLVFLLFQQTKSLFDGWLKQLMNFTLQPVLLIAFMAFFNGVFFNFLDNMFKEDYRVCFKSRTTSGQQIELSEFTFQKDKDGEKLDIKQVTETLNIFNLFVTMILAMTMVKMNQWVVSSSAQLTEGGLSFGQTMGRWGQVQSKITEGFSDVGRRTAGLPGGKKPK